MRTSQLQESAEIAIGQDKLAGYELHDLVVLSGGGSANEVGVIVRVGREEFTIVNNHGIAREARPEELRGKRNKASDRAVALDVQANQIRCGDSVTIVEGPHKGKVATIKRMSRAQLFLYSQFRTEHSGIFVVRSRSCVLTGGTKNGRGAGGAGGTPGDSPFSTPQSQNGRGPARGGDRDDSLMGKTVRIQAGQWKGYLGTVSHTTATHVQVELHSRLKKVMVVKERVHVIGDKFGATDNGDGGATSMSAPTGASFMGSTTPMHGGATPMHGGATPMHGGATPMHDGYGFVLFWDHYLPTKVNRFIFFLIHHVCFTTADRLLRTLACLTTFGGRADRLIAMLMAGRKGQILRVGGATLVILPRRRAIRLAIQLPMLEVSIHC